MYPDTVVLTPGRQLREMICAWAGAVFGIG
jgi:hypothetical protein